MIYVIHGWSLSVLQIGSNHALLDWAEGTPDGASPRALRAYAPELPLAATACFGVILRRFKEWESVELRAGGKLVKAPTPQAKENLIVTRDSALQNLASTLHALTDLGDTRKPHEQARVKMLLSGPPKLFTIWGNDGSS